MDAQVPQVITNLIFAYSRRDIGPLSNPPASGVCEEQPPMKTEAKKVLENLSLLHVTNLPVLGGEGMLC